jgi:hypothetical protein
MIQKNTLHKLLPGFYVLPLSAFLLALSRYSYRAKELLVCWLFFCSLFVSLAVLLLSSVLAWYAIHHLLNYISLAKTVTQELAVCLADTPQEAIPCTPFLATGTLRLPGDMHAIADTLASDACLSLDIPLGRE